MTFLKGYIPWNKGKKGLQIAWNKDKRFLKCSGKNHWAWKGGNSRGYKTGYYSLEYKQWRTKVFERDNWICQTCGVRSKAGEPIYLTAHHIKSFAKYPELRFEIDNGITLCENCHKLTDNYKGKGNRK